MKHDGWVWSAQFSTDGQRVVTAASKAAWVWDIPTITEEDSAEDTNLLANLAEATGGLALRTLGETEILAKVTPDQVKATRDKITALSSKLTPLSTIAEVERRRPEESNHLSFV